MALIRIMEDYYQRIVGRERERAREGMKKTPYNPRNAERIMLELRKGKRRKPSSNSILDPIIDLFKLPDYERVIGKDQ